ncbi:MAG: DUF1616 domain-containing protein [Candidatus Hydrothermarchaeaceae archaeon]
MMKGVRFTLIKALITVLLLIPPVVAAGEFEPSLVWENELNSSISSAAISPGGDYLAIGYYDNLVQVVNRTFDLLWFNRTEDAVRSMAFSSDGRYLVLSSGSELAFYDRWNLTWSKKDRGFVRDVAISGRGRFIAAGTGSSVVLMDRFGEVVQTFSTSTAVESVAVSSDGRFIAGGDQDSIYLFDRQGGGSWSYNLGGAVYDIAVSPDGGYIVAGSRDGYVYLFSRGERLLWANSLGTSPVYSVAVTPEAGYVVAGSREGLFLLGQDGEILWTRDAGHVMWVGMPSGGVGLAAVSGRRHVSLFSFPDTTPLSVEITAPANGSRVSGIVDVTVRRRGPAVTILLKIDGQEVSRSSSYGLNTRLISNGRHTLNAVATDTLGYSVTSSVEIFVDNDAVPSPIKIIAPFEGSVLSGTARIYIFTNTLFENVSLLIDGEAVSTGEMPYTWNTRAYSEGTHEIAVVGRRLGGEYLDHILVFVDNVPDMVSPSVSILQPFPEEEVNGTEAVRGVFTKQPSEVYLRIDGRMVSDSLPYLWDTSEEAEGTHELTLFALDESGNLGYYSTTVVKSAPDDPDGDGWSNELERLYRTDPLNPDTDGDGIIDPEDEDPLRDQGVFYWYLYGVVLLLLILAVIIKQKDIRLLLALTSIAAVFIAIPPLNSLPLRVPFALFLVFFAPGYAFISALFPRRDISPVERFTLSVAFSIALFVFNGFVLNYTWGFRTVPIVVTVSLITLAFALAAVLARRACPEGERFSIDFRLPRFDDSRPNEIERTLIIALVLSIFVASAMLVYAKVTFKHEEFTALYILGGEGKAEGYQKGFYIGKPQRITAGVENYERSPSDYRFEVRLNGAVLREESFSLDHKERWLKDISFISTQAGDRSKLEFLLYKNDDPASYRSVHLWVYSRPNYANPESFEEYSLRELPVIENRDFELNYSGWGFRSTNRNFTGGYTNDSYTSSPSSYKLSLPPGKNARKDNYAAVSQRVVSDKGGLVVLSFNVRDNYDNSVIGRYTKQMLLNGRVVWEEDAAERRGWEHFAVPVNFVPGTNVLDFRLYQKGEGSLSINVWWDDITVEPAGALFAL